MPPHGNVKRYQRYGCRCSECRAANAAEAAKYRKRDPKRYRNRDFKYKYGITTAQRNAMQQAQGNVCKICQKPFKEDTGNNGPQTDHNHKTDIVRGILCVCCNRALGLMKEDTLAMVRAVEYIETDGRFDRYAPGIGEGLL